jgi:hypothetical protein
MNRDEKLNLLQLAYSRWINEYPNEEMDQIDSHLQQIQTDLGLPLNVIGIEVLDF